MLDVLVVDDDELVRSCLTEALSDAGLRIGDNASGEEGLRRIGSDGPPAALVTDIDLGAGMDGLAFGAAARQLHPQLPVVYISGRCGSLDHLHERERFLPKPFPILRLLQALCELGSAEACRVFDAASPSAARG